MLLNEEDIKLNGSFGDFAPEPEPLVNKVKPSYATDEAFFAVQLLSKEMDLQHQDFLESERNLLQKGYDSTIEYAKQKVAEEQDLELRQTMTNLIEDPTVPKEEKVNLLNNYASFGLVAPDLRQQYATEVASFDNSDTIVERQSQDIQINDLNFKLQEAVTVRDANDKDDALEDIGGELVSFANLIASSAAGIVDFGVRVYDAIEQKITKGEVDWVENSTASERLEPGVIKNITGWKLDWVADKLGIREDFETSYINRTFNTIGEKLVALAEYSVEKGLFKNKEQAMFTMEAVGTAIPAGFAVKKAIKSIKHTPNGGADVTTKANPKKAGEDLTNALAEKTDTKVKELNTTKEAIIAENVLPKTGDLPDSVIPDIGNKLDEAISLEKLDPMDRIVFETFFDDNIGRREQRFADIQNRVKVSQESGLTVNVASSQIDMDINSLSGRMMFTKTPDYPYTKKKDILEDAERLQTLADKAKEIELKKDAGMGMKTDPKDIKHEVRVRDVDTKQEFTIDEFKKVKLDNRKFALVYDFKKKYNFMADDMLGTKLNDSNISLLGNKDVARAINASSLGEYVFGTGFSAKWFEQARAMVGSKAGRIKKEIHTIYKDKLSEHKKLKSEIADVIKHQAESGRDIIPRVELQRMFRGYKQVDIDAIDDVQRAYRKAQDTLHAINNEAYKLELKRQGFSKGYFDKDGNYKGAVKDISKSRRAEFEGENIEVYDPIKQEFVPFKLNKSRTDGIFNRDGRKLVVMENNNIIKARQGNKISDYALVKETDIDILPNKVLDKIPGYMQKEYKSKIFVEAIPKSMIVNGKRITDPKLLAQYVETKGTALTRKEAGALVDQIKNTLDDPDNYDISIRNSSIDTIKDLSDEYRELKDIYQNTKVRSESLITGEDVLMDPLHAFEKSVNRTVNTAAYTMYDKAFKQAFVRDFKDVLDGGRYPESIGQIRPKVEGDPAMTRLANEAKQLWRRQQHFQGVQTRTADVYFQNMLHSIADVFEKIKIPGINSKGAVIAREVGDLGLSGLNQKVMGYAGTLYITFSNPIRQLFIQPMMWFEQQMIYPRSFPKTMSRMPMHTLALIHQNNPLLRGTYNAYLKTLSKAEKADFLAENAAMRRQGILESVNLHLAMEEALKGHVGKLETGKGIKRVGEVAETGYEELKGVFNRYGFSNAELMNRIGLWLQNKYRWVDDPRNAGKNWVDIRNADEIAFEAWKQSGSMTRAGAVAMQRVPVLALLTQFQSIGLKSLMNIIQDNATNLTKADRVKLVGSRMLLHGVEFGAPLAAGKFLLDYLTGHEDPEVQEVAEELSRGVIDRMFLALTESDVSISEQASVSNINFLGDITGEMLNLSLIAVGSDDARAPNVPSVKAIGRVFEKFNDVKNMFTMNPVTPELLGESLVKLTEITSVGNSVGRALEQYAAQQILTKDGRRRGIPSDTWDAVFKSMGFNTRAEIDLYVAKQLARDEQGLISDAVDHYYSVIKSNIKGEDDFKKAASLINQSMSMMEQAGVFDANQMLKIKKAVISKIQSDYKANESYTIMKYINTMDPESERSRQIKERFRNHPDPIVQQSIGILDGKSMKSFLEE